MHKSKTKTDIKSYVKGLKTKFTIPQIQKCFDVKRHTISEIVRELLIDGYTRKMDSYVDNRITVNFYMNQSATPEWDEFNYRKPPCITKEAVFRSSQCQTMNV